MIEITNLTKRFGDKVAVDNITFNVNEGEIMGSKINGDEMPPLGDYPPPPPFNDGPMPF